MNGILRASTAASRFLKYPTPRQPFIHPPVAPSTNRQYHAIAGFSAPSLSKNLVDTPTQPSNQITDVRPTLSTKLPALPLTQTIIIRTKTKTKKKGKSGPRGARGHGWLLKYRAGLGGRHLQGRWHYRDVDDLNSINDEVFAMNKQLKFEGQDVPTEAFLDISVGEEEPKRVVIELAAAALPKTAENFRLLCLEHMNQDNLTNDIVGSIESNEAVDEKLTQEWATSGKGLGYASTLVYKIEKTVGLCMGDILSNNGSTGRCHPMVAAYPLNPFSFEDEGFFISHTGPGIVSMMSPGVHRNDSRFLITTQEAPQLDGRFVAFGRVKEECLGAVMDIANGVYTKRGVPTVEIKVVNCGVL